MNNSDGHILAVHTLIRAGCNRLWDDHKKRLMAKHRDGKVCTGGNHHWGEGKIQRTHGKHQGNESENKISHKGQHLPTKDDTYKIYTQREH